MTTQFSGKHVFALLLAAIFFVSCQKDTVTPPVIDPQPTGSLLHKVTINDTDSLVFDYAGNGALQKITSTEFVVGGGPAIFNFQYDPAGKVKEISSNAGVRYKFVYESGILKLTENFLNNLKVSENNFVWAGNRIISNTVFTGVDMGNGTVIYKPSYKATYQYDASGLLKKLSTFIINGATNEATLENERVIDQVDNNYNPLVVMEPLNLVAFLEINMPKNILKETLYNNQGVAEEITENNFVFDNQKRVISAVSSVSEPGHTPTPINVKYFYK
jgi:hypothetical protein